MKSLKILLIISAILFLTTQSRAQSITSGDVTGTVTDATGGSVPNATVELINPATNTSQKTATNTRGAYRFTFVPPGAYRLTVNASGFQAAERTGVVVTAGQPTTVNDSFRSRPRRNR